MSKNYDSEDQKKKICKGCGESKILNEFAWRVKKRGTRKSRCKNCINKTGRLEGLSLEKRLLSTLNSAKRRALDNDLEFELDYDWLKNKSRQQNNACSLTGIAFECTPRHAKSIKNLSSPFLPSIDKTLHDQHYVRDNCRLVCNVINVS